jgi:predicted nuclease of predicted toxin-antitoxin system
MGAAPRRVGDRITDAIGFLFDENIPPPFAKALQLAGYRVMSVEELGLRGLDDAELIEYCGDHDLVWVTNDLDARKRAAYGEQIQRHRVSATFLAPPRAKHWSSKEQFEVLARNIRTLEIRYRDRKPRYFLIRIAGQPRELPIFAARPGR